MTSSSARNRVLVASDVIETPVAPPCLLALCEHAPPYSFRLGSDYGPFKLAIPNPGRGIIACCALRDGAAHGEIKRSCP